MESYDGNKELKFVCRYQSTNTQIISDYISLTKFAAFIIYTVLEYRKKRFIE